jgi:hypothetical protein
MEVSLGFFSSPENILVKRFSLNKEFLGEDTIGIDELGSLNLNGLLLSPNQLDEEVLNKLKEENNFFPIQKGTLYSLDYSAFKTINPLLALNKIRDLNSSWAIKNNLILIENIFEIISNLKENLQKEREQFLIDLWHLIKSNLGAFGITLYFNDLEEGKKQIIKRKISGQKYPEILVFSETDTKILMALNEIPGAINFFPEKQEFLIKMKALGSPLLITGGCFSFTPLQRSLIKSLFKTLE